MDGQPDGWMDGWTNGRTDKRTDGQMNGRTDGQDGKSSYSTGLVPYQGRSPASPQKDQENLIESLCAQVLQSRGFERKLASDWLRRVKMG